MPSLCYRGACSLFTDIPRHELVDILHIAKTPSVVPLAAMSMTFTHPVRDLLIVDDDRDLGFGYPLPSRSSVQMANLTAIEAIFTIPSDHLQIDSHNPSSPS